MDIDETAGRAAGEDLLAEAEELFRTSAELLAARLRALREGRFEGLKETAQATRDLRAALQLALEERTRLEKLRRHEGGGDGERALDLAAARAEIGRRLACLRGAEDG